MKSNIKKTTECSSHPFKDQLYVSYTCYVDDYNYTYRLERYHTIYNYSKSTPPPIYVCNFIIYKEYNPNVPYNIILSEIL
jgi:hypothetical protein